MLLKFKYSLKVQGRVTITPNNFWDEGCYRQFFARFFVIFRVMVVIGGHRRAKIMG